MENISIYHIYISVQHQYITHTHILLNMRGTNKILLQCDIIVKEYWRSFYPQFENTTRKVSLITFIGKQFENLKLKTEILHNGNKKIHHQSFCNQETKLYILLNV